MKMDMRILLIILSLNKNGFGEKNIIGASEFHGKFQLASCYWDARDKKIIVWKVRQ
jgi:hypothetical protein